MTEYNILILTAPSGHMTLARAARSYLEDIPGVRITTLDLAGHHIEWSLFRILYRYLPSLMRIPYEITRNPHTLNMVKNNNIRRFETLLPSILEKEAPDLVITTYHGYIAVLDRVKDHYKFKYINSLSDPVSPHPILFSRSADYNIGFSEASCKVGNKLNISPERIVPAGWLTMRCFFEQQPLAEIRQKLKLKDQLTLLVCAGSEGSNAILNLLPVLFFTKHSRTFQVIFITGHNHTLANAIRRTYRLAARFNPGLPAIVVEEFTNEMHEFMAVSDIVIGKAGPNLIFESVASRKPFMAVTHFSGNEDGNLGMIRANNLGWVAENPFTASKLIQDLIRNPALLKAKDHDLEKIAVRCHQGGLFLREKVLEWKKPD
jgi:processive 1,2-diacylglycerol beta-glucosyltransferase